MLQALDTKLAFFQKPQVPHDLILSPVELLQNFTEKFSVSQHSFHAEKEMRKGLYEGRIPFVKPADTVERECFQEHKAFL